MPWFNDGVFALKLNVEYMDPKDRCFSHIWWNGTEISSGVQQWTGYNWRVWGSRWTWIITLCSRLCLSIYGMRSPTKSKQPLAYFFTAGTVRAETLQTLTHWCLAKLEAIGLDTMALICDQGTNNRRFLQTLEKVSIKKPYIVYNNKRVFVIYDPPHLLKNVRNNFMKSNYKYGDVEVRWQYIVDFYNRDKTMSIRMAPKLTDRHIILPLSLQCV